MRTIHLGVLVLAASLAWLMPARAADRTEITFPGDHAYPESLTATSDGTIYAGSLYEGGIFRVPPGATIAEQWIRPGANDSMITLGVFADEKAGTLWVCSSNLTGFGVKPPEGEKPVSLKAFDLKSGAGKGSWSLPAEKSLCNDMVVGADGAVYVTDSFQPHILKLALASRLRQQPRIPRFDHHRAYSISRYCAPDRGERRCVPSVSEGKIALLGAVAAWPQPKRSPGSSSRRPLLVVAASRTPTRDAGNAHRRQRAADDSFRGGDEAMHARDLESLAEFQANAVDNYCQ
jgi:hypothetical protein